MKRNIKIQVVRTKGLFWHIRLTAPNNRIRLASETYFSKSNAIRAAKKLSEETGWGVEVR